MIGAGGASTRSRREAELAAALDEVRPDLICLAGFMRILSADFVARWPLRILNVHPSLLPSFPGLEAQAQALDYGVRVTGATVHFVDAGTDSGPIVAQAAVPVHPRTTTRTRSRPGFCRSNTRSTSPPSAACSRADGGSRAAR